MEKSAGRHRFTFIIKTIMSDHYIWVAVRVNDGTNIFEYYGRMETEQYSNIVHNIDNDGWFLLEDVTWEINGRFSPQATEGKNWGYSDSAWYRVYDLTRIIPLDEEFVMAKLFPLRRSMGGNGAWEGSRES